VNRIDEALRRASEGRGVAGRGADHQAHFVSAWSERTTAAPTVAAPVAKPQPDTSERSLLALAPELAPAAMRGRWAGELAAAVPSPSNVSMSQQYRRLAAILHKAQTLDGVRSVMVTSAMGSDGKTVTALNLALVLSGSYKRRVLLIDADLRNPSIGRLVGVSPDGGLSDALKSPTDSRIAVVPLTPMLTLLPGGPPEPDPTSGLTSTRMRRIFDEAVDRFDWVVVDAPPVGPVADAGHLAEMVDRTLLVIRAERTQYPAVQKALETLGRERLLGVVLNGVDRRGVAAPEYGYSYSSSAVDGHGFHTMSPDSESLLR
jgi:capsular exopolysaccharide synthesis family protein